RPKPGVREAFLPYLLLGNKDRLLNLVDLAGHGTGRLNSDELNAFDVVLPSEPEQRAIAHILGTLDDKIELNRRMNDTLEELARVWMVDVRPGEHAVCSTEFLVLRALGLFTRSYVYCLARSPLFRRQIEGLVTGTSKSHQRAQVDSILNLASIVPPSSIVAMF